MVIARRSGHEREQCTDMSALFSRSFAREWFGLELFEQHIEALVVLFEELAITFDPIDRLVQSPRFEFAWTPLRIDVRRDETGTLEHLEMLGYGRLAHLERLGELGHRGLAPRQPRQDSAARGVGQCGEDQVEAFRSFHNRLVA